MLKKHIVLFETKNYDWVAYSTTGSDAKRILSVNKNYNIFYVHMSARLMLTHVVYYYVTHVLLCYIM